MAILRQLERSAGAGDRPATPRSWRGRTPSWKEFQPRLGLRLRRRRRRAAPSIRGGYGIFYDQLFQNLTLFSLSQSGPEIFSTLLNLTNTAVGVGQLASFRYGVDPLPAPPPAGLLDPARPARSAASTIPNAEEPYVQKLSIGFQQALGHRLVALERLRPHPRLRRAALPEHQPAHRERLQPGVSGLDARPPRCCLRGVNSRYFDRAFVAAGHAGQPARADQHVHDDQRVEVRQLDDDASAAARAAASVSVSYVLARSRSWGGQPTASYSGNGIAIDPENQFIDGECGPDAARRAPPRRGQRGARAAVELPGRADLPVRERAAVLAQHRLRHRRRRARDHRPALRGRRSRRPCSPCAATPPRSARSTRSAARRSRVNSQRGGFVVNPDGTVEEVQRPLLQRRPAGHEERSTSAAHAVQASTPTSTTCSTPRTCTSAATAVWA